ESSWLHPAKTRKTRTLNSESVCINRPSKSQCACHCAGIWANAGFFANGQIIAPVKAIIPARNQTVFLGSEARNGRKIDQASSTSTQKSKTESMILLMK